MFSLSKTFRVLVPSAGAMAVLVTIACWTILVALGFALIYWPNLPSGFKMPESAPMSPIARFGVALYFSFESLATLGQGDVAPVFGWLRMLSIAEALLGFSLLTASISWVVLIYPALGRMRTLARFAANMVRAEKKTGVDFISSDTEQLIGNLAHHVIRTRVDFIHFPLIYYFFAISERASLPEALPHLLRLAKTGRQTGLPERVRISAAMLESALEDFAEILAHRFVKADPANAEEVFRAFQKDHLIEQTD